MNPAQAIYSPWSLFRLPTIVTYIIAVAGCFPSGEHAGREGNADLQLDLVHAWSFPGPGQEEPWTGVSDAAFTPDGSVLVVDGVGRGIYRITQDGRGIAPVSRDGEGPGEFRQPVNIASLGESLVVWDPGQTRILRIEGDSVVQTLRVHTAVSLSTQRTLYAMSAARFLVQTRLGHGPGQEMAFGFVIQDTSGAVLDTVRPPWPPAKPHTITGPRGAGTVPLTPVDLWIVTEDDEIVAVHTGSYDVVRLTVDGDTLGIVTRATERVPVQPGEADGYRQAVEYSFRRTDPSWSWPRSVAFPDYKPAISGLAPLSGGGFVVIRHGPGVEFPERRSPGRLHWSEKRTIDLYGPEGIFLGSVDLPLSQLLVKATPDRILTSQRDDLGRTHLHMYYILRPNASH